MDIFDLLVGDPRNAQLVKQLRGQNVLGILGTATGDKALAPAGQSLASQATSGAEHAYNVQRQAQEASALEKWRQTQTDTARMNNEADAKAAADRLAMQQQLQAERLAAQAALVNQRAASAAELAAAKADAESKKYKEMTNYDKQALEKVASEFSAFTAIPEFKDSYAQPIGKWAGDANNLNQTLTRMGYNSAKGDEAANWKAAFDALYTLGARKNLFGATLTSNEQKSWQDSNISAGMEPKDVRVRLERIRGVVKSAAKRARDRYEAMGYDPKVLSSFGIPTNDEIETMLSGAPTAGATGGWQEVNGVKIRVKQ